MPFLTVNSMDNYIWPVYDPPIKFELKSGDKHVLFQFSSRADILGPSKCIDCQAKAAIIVLWNSLFPSELNDAIEELKNDPGFQKSVDALLETIPLSSEE